MTIEPTTTGTDDPAPANRPLLAMPPGPQRELVWSAHAQRTAAALHLNVDVPAKTPALTDTQAWADLLAGRRAVITGWGSPRLTEAVLASNQQLQFVGHAAGSVAGIVSNALFNRDVRICSANQLIARSVADWSVMMTLIAARRLWEHVQFNKSPASLPWVYFPRQVPGISDMVVGIWGFGDVGQAFAKLLAPLEPAEVLVCDPRPLKELQPPTRQVDIETLFQASDILHLMAPLNVSTRGRINADLLRRMEPGATLVNAARAHLVVEDALLDVLRSGRIHAVLDVFHEEPLPRGNELTRLSNVILTPHTSGQGRFHQMASEMLHELDRLRRNTPLRHEVEHERAMAMTNESLRSG